MRRKLLFLAFITLAGNSILGYFVFKSNQNRLISEYWVQHTMQVRYQADKLFTVQNQVRTALKAYNLTRDTSFLEPLYITQKSILKNIEVLTFLTKDNPLEQRRLLLLHATMQQFLDHSFEEAGIKINPSNKALKVQVNPEKASGQIRAIINSIQKEEAELLQLRTQRNVRDVTDFNRLTLIVFSLMAGFTILLLITIRRIFIQGREKDLRANELSIANETLYFENDEKVKRADELVIAKKELSYQNGEKEDRAAELVVANIELTFQNKEKEKRANELIIANKELLYQNKEKENRAAELIIANKELSFQNEEKEKRAIELKEMISLLNDSEIFNRGILNSLSSHIAVMDSSGKLIAVNDSWNKFTLENGHTTLQRTGVGSNYFEFCANAFENGDLIAGEAMRGIREVLNELRQVFYMEYPCHSPDEQRWFGMRATKFEGADNLVVVSHLNVTERKMAEQNLLIRETSLNEAQAIAHIGNFELDLIRKTDFWSDEMYNILGLNKEETIPSAETFWKYVHPDDLMIVKEGADQTVEKSQNRNFEFRFIRNDGSLRYGQTELQLEMDNQKRPVRIVGIFRDITKGKAEELERAKMVNELLTRNKDLMQFGYIVSHNFRSPIANILGASEALKDPDLSLEDKQILKNGINVSVLKLDQVVKDLNYILEIKTMINERKEMVNFCKLVDDIKESIRNMIIKHKFKITYDFSEAGEILSLRPYLYSIFYNLITNSIKYRQIGIPGIISIKSRKVGDAIELIFTDNGMGIDLLKKGSDVFVMYKRFHEHIEGKGMGLYMVKTQVEALNGKITLKSTVNQGCIFSIAFAV
jgi:PAS domain S-box-containing protein